MYFRSLATENSSEYSTRENITDYSTSGRGEYFKLSTHGVHKANDHS
jgi:hypothetical protein